MTVCKQACVRVQDSAAQRPFASTATCRKSVITTRILQLVHELCVKRIHVTKRDLFYTDVKLFEVRCFPLVHHTPLTDSRHHILEFVHPLELTFVLTWQVLQVMTKDIVQRDDHFC